MTFTSGSTLPQNHKPPKHNKCTEVHSHIFKFMPCGNVLCYMIITAVA